MNLFLEKQKVERKRDLKRYTKQIEVVLRMLGVSLLVFVFFYGGYLLLCFGPFLNAQHVHVQGKLNVLSHEQIRQISSVLPSDNLFWLDVERIHQKIKGNPWVKTVTVRRKPPHTVWIYVEEHEPYALLQERNFYILSKLGEVIKLLETKDHKDLPVITGMLEKRENPSLIPELKETELERMKEVFEILKWFDLSPFNKNEQVAELNYNSAKGYSIITKNDPMQILLGKTNLEARMKQIDNFSQEILDKVSHVRYVVPLDEDKIIVRHKT